MVAALYFEHAKEEVDNCAHGLFCCKVFGKVEPSLAEPHWRPVVAPFAMLQEPVLSCRQLCRYAIRVLGHVSQLELCM